MRLLAERDRTTTTLAAFAEVVGEGGWVNASIDPGDEKRKPVPKPDVRRMLRPLGPVAVFGASNFPLAYSTAGGDTASALAAGCPVIVKGHPAHPGTGEAVARAVAKAVRNLRLHPGTFGFVHSGGERVHSVGERARDEPVRARGRVHGLDRRRCGGLGAGVVAGRPDPGVRGDGLDEPGVRAAQSARATAQEHRGAAVHVGRELGRADVHVPRADLRPSDRRVGRVHPRAGVEDGRLRTDAVAIFGGAVGVRAPAAGDRRGGGRGPAGRLGAERRGRGRRADVHPRGVPHDVRRLPRPPDAARGVLRPCDTRRRVRRREAAGGGRDADPGEPDRFGVRGGSGRGACSTDPDDPRAAGRADRVQRGADGRRAVRVDGARRAVPGDQPAAFNERRRVRDRALVPTGLLPETRRRHCCRRSCTTATRWGSGGSSTGGGQAPRSDARGRTPRSVAREGRGA